MNVFIIDNYDSFTYNLYQLISSLGHRVVVKRNDSFRIEEIKKYHAVVISPGPGRPGVERDTGLSENVIKIYKNKPILGVCLGHQILAYVYNAKIEKSKKIMHGKVSKITHEDDPLFYGLKDFYAGRYHSLVVSKDNFPDDLKIIAESENEIMAIRHREYLHYGLQFHPESILTPSGKRIMKNFFNLVGDFYGSK